MSINKRHEELSAVEGENNDSREEIRKPMLPSISSAESGSSVTVNEENPSTSLRNFSSQVDVDHNLYSQGNGIEDRTTQKCFENPKLFRSTINDVTNSYIWSDLGMFDEQDLEAEYLFILVQPRGKSFLWIGDKFKFQNKADGWQPNPDIEDDCKLCRNVAKQIDQGDLEVVVPIFNNDDLLDDAKCALVFAGAESEEWWDVLDTC